MHFLLFVHIIGGVAAMGIVACSVISLILKKGNPGLLITALKLSSIFEVVTGVSILLFGQNVSIAAVCYKNAAYILVAIILQYAISYRFSSKLETNA